jgi:hypothetical protein
MQKVLTPIVAPVDASGASWLAVETNRSAPTWSGSQGSVRAPPRSLPDRRPSGVTRRRGDAQRRAYPPGQATRASPAASASSPSR